MWIIWNEKCMKMVNVKKEKLPPGCIVNNVASTYNHLQRPAECLINRRLTVITYFSFSLLPRSCFPFVSWLKIRFSFTFHEKWKHRRISAFFQLIATTLDWWGTLLVNFLQGGIVKWDMNAEGNSFYCSHREEAFADQSRKLVTSLWFIARRISNKPQTDALIPHRLNRRKLYA